MLNGTHKNYYFEFCMPVLKQSDACFDSESN